MNYFAATQFEEEMAKMVIAAKGSEASPEELREFTLGLAGTRPYSAVEAARTIIHYFAEGYSWSEIQKMREPYNPRGIPLELINDITDFWPYLIAEVPLREAIGRLMRRTVMEIIRGKINLEEIKDGIKT